MKLIYILKIKKNAAIKAQIILLLPAALCAFSVKATLGVIILTALCSALQLVLNRYLKALVSDYVYAPIVFTILGLITYLCSLIPNILIDNPVVPFAGVSLSLFLQKFTFRSVDLRAKSKAILFRFAAFSAILLSTALISELLSTGGLFGLIFLPVSVNFFSTFSGTLLLMTVLGTIAHFIIGQKFDYSNTLVFKQGTAKLILISGILSTATVCIIKALSLLLLSRFMLTYLDTLIIFTLCGSFYPVLKLIDKKLFVGKIAVSVIPILTLVFSMLTYDSSKTILASVITCFITTLLAVICLYIIQIIGSRLCEKHIPEFFRGAPAQLMFLSVASLLLEKVIGIVSNI